MIGALGLIGIAIAYAWVDRVKLVELILTREITRFAAQHGLGDIQFKIVAVGRDRITLQDIEAPKLASLAIQRLEAEYAFEIAAPFETFSVNKIYIFRTHLSGAVQDGALNLGGLTDLLSATAEPGTEGAGPTMNLPDLIRETVVRIEDMLLEFALEDDVVTASVSDLEMRTTSVRSLQLEGDFDVVSPWGGGNFNIEGGVSPDGRVKADINLVRGAGVFSPLQVGGVRGKWVVDGPHLNLRSWDAFGFMEASGTLGGTTFGEVVDSRLDMTLRSGRLKMEKRFTWPESGLQISKTVATQDAFADKPEVDGLLDLHLPATAIRATGADFGADADLTLKIGVRAPLGSLRLLGGQAQQLNEAFVRGDPLMALALLPGPVRFEGRLTQANLLSGVSDLFASLRGRVNGQAPADTPQVIIERADLSMGEVEGGATTLDRLIVSAEGAAQFSRGVDQGVSVTAEVPTLDITALNVRRGSVSMPLLETTASVSAQVDQAAEGTIHRASLDVAVADGRHEAIVDEVGAFLAELEAFRLEAAVDPLDGPNTSKPVDGFEVRLGGLSLEARLPANEGKPSLFAEISDLGLEGKAWLDQPYAAELTAQTPVVSLQIAEEPVLSSVSASINSRVKGKEISFTGDLMEPMSDLSMKVAGHHVLDTGSGRLRMDLPKGAHPKGEARLLSLFPALGRWLDDLSGRLAGRADLVWEPDGMRADIDLSLKDGEIVPTASLLPVGVGSVALGVEDLSAVGSTPLNDLPAARSEITVRHGVMTSKLGRVVDVNVDAKLAGLSPPTTQTPIRLRFGSVEGALPAVGGAIDLMLTEDGALDVKSAEVALLGGEVRTQAVSIPLTKADLEVHRLSLSQIVEAYDIRGLSGEALFSGMLPVNVTTDGTLSVDQAVLSSINGGRLSLKPPADDTNRWAGAVGETPMALVLEMLSDFHYEKINATINGDVRRGLGLSLRLIGNNPKVANGRQADVTMTFSGTLGDTLHAELESFDLKEMPTRRRETPN